MVTLEKKKIYIFLRFSNLQNKDVHQFLFNDIKILNIKILKLNKRNHLPRGYSFLKLRFQRLRAQLSVRSLSTL